LAGESLWVDEAISLIEVEQQDINSMNQMVYDIELSPYGYHLILRQWVNFFGNSEVSIRLLSVIFSVTSIIVLFFLASLLFSRKVALISCLLMSTAMLQIVYAQEARLWTMFGFLALLSTYFFFRAITLKSNVKNNFWKYYGFITLLSLYVSYIAILLIIIQSSMFFFDKYKKQLKNWVMVQVILFILFLPILRYMISQSINKYPAWIPKLIAIGIPPIIANLGVFFFISPIIILIIGLFIFLHFKDNLKKINIKFNPKIFYSFLFFTIIVYLTLFKNITRSFAVIRHLFFLLPLVYIGIAKGIDLINKKKIQSIIIILILLFNSVMLISYYSNPTKPEWREAVTYVEDNSANTPLILFDNSGSTVYLFNYYSKFESRQINLNNNFDGGSDRTELINTLDLEESFWFVSSRDPKKLNFYSSFFNEQFEQIDKKEFKEVSVFHYR